MPLSTKQNIDYKLIVFLLLFIVHSALSQISQKSSPLGFHGCIYHKDHTTTTWPPLFDFAGVFEGSTYQKSFAGNNTTSTNIHPVVALAKQYLGKPYRSGGKGPKGFDCSGFVGFIYRQFGVELPPSSQEQAARAVHKIAKNEANIGDLAFFGYRSPKGRLIINHAAIVISEPGSPIRIIHSANGKGICITDIEKSKYWRQAFLFAGKIKNEYFNHSNLTALLQQQVQAVPLM